LGSTLTKLQVESSDNRNKELTQRVRQQVTGLNRAIMELKNQVATLTAERDALKAQAPSTASQDSPDLKVLQDRIAALQQEKSSLEASLNEVRAKATELSNQTATLVSEQCSGLTPCLTGFTGFGTEREGCPSRGERSVDQIRRPAHHRGNIQRILGKGENPGAPGEG
jgi:uncharacterized small protein (DUF1192 family)